MERLTHGYTNGTTRVGEEVIKDYRGPDAADRARREGRILSALAGRVPVPPVRAVGPTVVRTGFVPGTHGQDLITAGHGAMVMQACGTVLRQIQAVDPAAVLDDPPPGAVLVHGDFGPNNLLLDVKCSVNAVVDWEWVHAGDSLEDLAWCEWILRMHHPSDAASALPALFAAYGSEPHWRQRQAHMLRRCQELRQFAARWEPDGPGTRQWTERLAVTAGWSREPGS